MVSRHERPDYLSASRSIERILSTIGRCGLTPSEFRVLAALAEDECELVELAGRLDLPAVTVRRAARQLAMRGLIRRRRGARRRARASLMTSGLTTLRLLIATASTPETRQPISMRAEPLAASPDPEAGTFPTQRV